MFLKKSSVRRRMALPVTGCFIRLPRIPLLADFLYRLWKIVVCLFCSLLHTSWLSVPIVRQVAIQCTKACLPLLAKSFGRTDDDGWLMVVNVRLASLCSCCCVCFCLSVHDSYFSCNSIPSFVLPWTTASVLCQSSEIYFMLACGGPKLCLVLCNTRTNNESE